MKSWLTFIYVVFLFGYLPAQNPLADSLVHDLNRPMDDTSRVNTLELLVNNLFLSGEYEQCRPWSDSLEWYATRANDSVEIARAKLYRGGTYQFVGLFSPGMKSYFDALNIRTLLQDTAGIAQCNLRIGQCYSGLGDLDTGYTYENRALLLYTALNDQRGTAQACNALGGTLMDMKHYDDAMKYYYEALRLRILLGDTRAIGQTYNNLGLAYYQQGKADSALPNYRRALDIKLKAGDTASAASTYNNIALVYIDVPDYDSVIFYSSIALPIAERSGNLDIQKSAHSYLSAAYEAKGNFEEALKHEHLYESFRDSIFNEDNTRESINAKLEYEYDKKEALANADFNAQLEQRNLILGATGIGLLLVLAFSVFIYSRFRLIRRQKKIIEEQKILSDHQNELISEKNKEIVDSINYARRLQEAILPPEKLIDECLPSSFILYLPKDIVAGDFYWLVKTDYRILFATADCTGHGVPGAMVSVVCSNALNRTVKEFGVTDPGKILDKVRELILQTFENSANEVNDGMDICLCSFPINRKDTVEFAGANRSLIIVHADKTITEHSGNKQPVGRTEHAQPFQTRSISIASGDTLYMMTDGFADQFGGGKGKKLKMKSLLEVLRQNSDQPVTVQKEILFKYFIAWKGTLEQVDDVLLSAIKI